MPIYKCECEDEWFVNAKNEREALKIVLAHEKNRLEKWSVAKWKSARMMTDTEPTPEYIKLEIAEDQRLIREGFTAKRIEILNM